MLTFFFRRYFLLLLICPMTAIASSHYNPTIFTVKSVEVGDYCWITGSQTINKKIKINTYLVNTPAEKQTCLSGDSQIETKAWKGKQLIIKTQIQKICQHNPPCEETDTMINTPAITAYQEIK